MCESAKCLEEQRQNEERNKIRKEAQRLANETGEWVAIYRDEYGEKKLIQAQQAATYPVLEFISPQRSNASGGTVV